RDWAINPTILSGDLNNSFTEDSGDSHTIVTMIDNNSELNGFIIQSGYADLDNDTAALPIGRSGAGIFNIGDNKIYNCIIRNNKAEADNAGTESGIGAGLVSFGGNLQLVNCLFHSNTSNANGGAISVEGGTTHIINSTVANNHAQKGGGVHYSFGVVNAVNSIFYQNSGINGNMNDDGGPDPSLGLGTASHSLFYNTTEGNNSSLPPLVVEEENNIYNTDPNFANPTNHDYLLQNNSPALNVGLNTANTLTTDLFGYDRVVNCTIDLGPFENPTVVTPTQTIVYVNLNATGNNDGTSWADAYTSLQTALANTSPCVNQEVWVATGTYKPGTLETDSFEIPANKKVLGGFDGTETNAGERNWHENPTILSGDLNNS